MRRGALAGATLGTAVAVLAAGGAQGATAKSLLRLSEGGEPVAQGADVGFRLVLQPAGYPGSALQIGGGPLVNEANLDSVRAQEGGDAAGAWDVQGRIESVSLGANGKATISTSGEAISNNEPEGAKPPPPPSAVRLSRSAYEKWECFYPLPKHLKGTFSTSGSAVVHGTTTAKASRLCHLPGLSVSFTLEMLPGDLSGPALETSLVPRP